MNNDVKEISHNAARFWFEASQYFESICQLAESISNQLTKEGYIPTFQSYGLKFAAYDQGETRLVHDRLKNHWFGRFSVDAIEEQQENIIYGFGISFGFINPDSEVEPWIPLVYIFKGKTVENEEWNEWDHSRILFAPSNLLAQSSNVGEYLISLDVDNFDSIEHVSILVFPLGAIRSTDDIAKIVKPSVEALRANDENKLEDIKPYLLSLLSG